MDNDVSGDTPAVDDTKADGQTDLKDSLRDGSVSKAFRDAANVKPEETEVDDSQESNTEPDDKSDKEEDIDYKAAIAELKKQNEEAQKFIGERNNELGELRKKVDELSKGSTPKKEESAPEDAVLKKLQKKNPEQYKMLEASNRAILNNLLKEAGIGLEDLSYMRQVVTAQQEQNMLNRYAQEGQQLLEEYGEAYEKHLKDIEKEIKDSGFTISAKEAFKKVAFDDFATKKKDKKEAANRDREERGKKAALENHRKPNTTSDVDLSNMNRRDAFKHILKNN